MFRVAVAIANAFEHKFSVFWHSDDKLVVIRILFCARCMCD